MSHRRMQSIVLVFGNNSLLVLYRRSSLRGSLFVLSTEYSVEPGVVKGFGSDKHW